MKTGNILKGVWLLVVLMVAVIHAKSPEACQDDETQAHESDCNKFYRCKDGKLVPDNCPRFLHYNSRGKVCDWPMKARCNVGTFVKDTEEQRKLMSQYDNPSPSQLIRKQRDIPSSPESNSRKQHLVASTTDWETATPTWPTTWDPTTTPDWVTSPAWTTTTENWDTSTDITTATAEPTSTPSPNPKDPVVIEVDRPVKLILKGPASIDIPAK